ncbi:MAG: RDD family protein [Caldilineaceae bacterium]
MDVKMATVDATAVGTAGNLPVPDHNTSQMGMYAGFVTRAVALMIDIALITVAVIAINALLGLPVSFFTGINLNNCAQATDPRDVAKVACAAVNMIWVGVALLASPIYFITLFATIGQTIGKAVMGVRVVRLDGRAMTFKSGTVRWLGYFVSVITLGLGFAWVIVDSRRQGFHDRMANTSVIYAWRATGSERLVARVRGYFSKRG